MTAAATRGTTPATLPPLPRRPSTAESAAELLRAQITEGRLDPGTQLLEEQVAAALSISRNTVREAFRLLSHERLVEHIAHRGVFVRVVSAHDIQAMYLTRRLIEPLGIDAALADRAALTGLRDLVEGAQHAADDDDWNTVGTADIAFHRALVAACGSSHVSGMFERLLAELRLAFLQMHHRRELHEPFLRRNGELVRLMEGGDRDGARAEMRDYLDAAEHTLLEALHALASRAGQSPTGQPPF